MPKETRVPAPKHRPQCVKTKHDELIPLMKRRNDAFFSSSPSLDPEEPLNFANGFQAQSADHLASFLSSTSYLQALRLVELLHLLASKEGRQEFEASVLRPLEEAQVLEVLVSQTSVLEL